MEDHLKISCNINKKRKVQASSSSKDTEEVSSELSYIYKTEGLSLKSKIVDKVYEASPNRIKRIMNSIPTPGEVVVQFTPEQALALFLDLGLSKSKYELLRTRLKNKNFKALPSYKKVVAAKANSVPCPIAITEVSASVKLQDLLNHTAQRIVQVPYVMLI